MIVALVVIAILIAVGFLIYTSFKASKKNPLPVLVKILLNHIQVNSQLGGIMSNVPTLVTSMMGVQSQASAADPSALAAMDCLLRPNFYLQFIAVVALPWLLSGLSFIALNELHKYQKSKWRLKQKKQRIVRNQGLS